LIHTFKQIYNEVNILFLYIRSLYLSSLYSQNTTDMPLETMAQPAAYPTTENMTTANAKAPEQVPEETNAGKN
jgi:hypothetical protein